MYIYIIYLFIYVYIYIQKQKTRGPSKPGAQIGNPREKQHQRNGTGSGVAVLTQRKQKKSRKAAIWVDKGVIYDHIYTVTVAFLSTCDLEILEESWWSDGRPPIFHRCFSTTQDMTNL